jgi:hypothetical protein
MYDTPYLTDAPPPRGLKRSLRCADQQGMRRLLAIALLAAFVAAGTALAATPVVGTFQAQKDKVQKGYEFSFTVTGARRTITNLRARILETCEGAPTSRMITVRPTASWTVRSDGKFNARKKLTRAGATVYVSLEGHFASATKAVGSIRQTTTAAGTRCDTYKVPFTAKRR